MTNSTDFKIAAENAQRAADEKHKLKNMNASLQEDVADLKRDLAAEKAKSAVIAELEDKIEELKKQLAAAQGQKEIVVEEKIVEVTKMEKDVGAIALLEASYNELQEAYKKLQTENRALERELEIFGPEARPHRRYDWVECPIKTVRQGNAMCGFLAKAGKSRRGAWKKRFFILNQDCLFWYKSDDSLQKKAKYVRLQGARVNVHKESKVAHHHDGFKMLKHPFPFRLDSDIKDEDGEPVAIIFNADDEKERTEWVVALRTAIDRVNELEKKAPPSPRASGRRDRGKSLVSQMALAAAAEEQEAEKKKKSSGKLLSP